MPTACLVPEIWRASRRHCVLYKFAYLLPGVFNTAPDKLNLHLAAIRDLKPLTVVPPGEHGGVSIYALSPLGKES